MTNQSYQNYIIDIKRGHCTVRPTTGKQHFLTLAMCKDVCGGQLLPFHWLMYRVDKGYSDNNHCITIFPNRKCLL